MEYNVRNLFLEKSYTEYGGKTIPRPFSKKSKLSLSQDQKSKFLYSLYLLYTKFWGLLKYIELKFQTTFYYDIHHFFEK